MKNTKILLITFFLFVSCGGLKEAGSVLRNEKIKNTDEFLVKKRNPLVLPPNYEKIPEPGSIRKKNEDDKDKIKRILKVPQTDNSIKSSSSVEESILKRIRK